METIQTRNMQGRVADAPSGHWVYRLLPRWLWPYAQIARWDRPIGWQLLLWPCLWSLALAATVIGYESDLYHTSDDQPSALFRLAVYAGLFLIGAIAMRGAGCTWNDILDTDIDAKVERTASRPLPSGQIKRRSALVFLALQSLIGLAVLLQFNSYSIWLGIASLGIVAIYPLMKRVTDFPQLVLGLAFSWGALMGWAILFETLDAPALWLYAATVLWVVGYDTIYAHQDREDDALIGVRSTARLFGKHTKPAVALLYVGMIALMVFAFISAGMFLFAYIGLAAAALHLGMQIKKLDINDADQCLRLFKSNTLVGWLILLGLVGEFAFAYAA
jgi:4-hydroxybenzoate polyprenyltransferase